MNGDFRWGRMREGLTSMGMALLGGHLLAACASAQVVAVPMPDPKIPGFRFPEPEAKLIPLVEAMTGSSDPKVAKAAFDAVHLHGWGIWTALTSETDQVVEGQKLRVFETWYTPNDLPSGRGDFAALKANRRARSPLRTLRQFERSRPARSKFLTKSGPGIGRIAGFVKYDPSAAEHIVQQGLLEKGTLDALLDSGANAISPFPPTAVALKPVFQVISLKGLPDGRYYQLPVWPGPPATPQAWGPDKWPGAVWIDIKDGGSGKGGVDSAPKADGNSRTDATTYPLSSLIHFKLDETDAKNWNATVQGGTAEAGDFAILVAMHTTSKEITRWTWQTFWWSPTPEQPHLPSSAEVAALRPAELTGAPRNYAMSLGYSMVAPPQPYVGGSNIGESVYAYNPWLEAAFTPADLLDSIPGQYDGKTVANNFGVQTNCMSCHGGANYNPKRILTAPNYTGDRYLDLDDPRFVNTLKVDFLWSLPDNAK